MRQDMSHRAEHRATRNKWHHRQRPTTPRGCWSADEELFATGATRTRGCQEALAGTCRNKVISVKKTCTVCNDGLRDCGELRDA